MSEDKGYTVVLPGEQVGELRGRSVGPGVYVRDDKVYSEVVGVPKDGKEEVSVIPFAGKYMPQLGDKVVGVVKEVEISGWIIDINAPYVGFLPISEAVEEYVDARADLTKFFDRGDVIFCKISRVTKSNAVQCSMRDMLARKLKDGTVAKVTPSKVPRVVGKSGNMVNLIKERTGCEVFTGQNGCVWLRGGRKDLAIKALKLIDRESHLPGLTEKVESVLGGEGSGS